MAFRVLLVGLTARDDRLVEIVLTRTPNLKHTFEVVRSVPADQADLVIVDHASPDGMAMAASITSSAVTAIYISDAGDQGASPYRLERRALLIRLVRLIDDAVAALPKTRPAPSVAAASATPAASPASPAVPSRPTPVPAAEAPLFAAPTPTDPGLNFRPLRALVVDDSAVVRDLLRDALQRIGIACDLAASGEEAQRVLQHQAFDIAMLDVVMPGMDGYDLCRKIKQNPYTRGIPVMMLTSRSSPFDRARGSLAGCDAYLAKPIAPDAFYSTIDRLLTRHFRNDRTALNARGYRAYA